MTFKLTEGWPQKQPDGYFVNPDTNPEYLNWLAQGNVPESADLPAASILTTKEPQ